jgi:protein-S-isoprenylcysteine O-methyltransferase Ste14
MAWVYIGLSLGMIAVLALILVSRSPDLIAERGQIKADAKGWDKVLATLAGLVGPLVTLLVAGLDKRFGWSSQIALAAQLAALVFTALGYGLLIWAMASNRFFSSVVRIQRERGHTVVSGGPYRYVRHPGYVGMIIAWLGTPVMFGSLWALLPAALTVVVVVIRTALEDRTLRDELDDYQAYAQRVRYRLLPGVW